MHHATGRVFLATTAKDGPCGGCIVGGVGLNFGNANPNTTTINPDILGGWGVRPYDWQFGASIQHELLPRISVTAGYYHRDYHNLRRRDNTLQTFADYTPFTTASPIDGSMLGLQLSSSKSSVMSVS